jgi:hypothetical protein
MAPAVQTPASDLLELDIDFSALPGEIKGSLPITDYTCDGCTGAHACTLTCPPPTDIVGTGCCG